MKLTPPTQAIFFLSLIVALIALVIGVGAIAFPISAFWLMAIAYVLLLLGNVVENL
jgi:hypothetical protein